MAPRIIKSVYTLNIFSLIEGIQFETILECRIFG